MIRWYLRRGHKLIREASEESKQQAQQSLRAQLRKNPHHTERPPAKSFARCGVRTYGFFCGRHKRLAFERPRCSSRRLRASVATDQDHSMHWTPQREIASTNRCQCGSTLGTVEEENQNKSVHTRDAGVIRSRIAGRGRDRHPEDGHSTRQRFSTPPYYCYHTSSTTQHTHSNSATSHVVARSVSVEDRGGSR